MKPQILFVDDEPNVLAGIQDSLRRQRHQWDLVFVSDEPSAMAELRRREFDVVVSDMRMVGADGTALLSKVKELRPAASRIILTGEVNAKASIRAIAVAHQFIAK